MFTINIRPRSVIDRTTTRNGTRLSPQISGV